MHCFLVEYRQTALRWHKAEIAIRRRGAMGSDSDDDDDDDGGDHINFWQDKRVPYQSLHE
jgi:hypothetical protein